MKKIKLYTPYIITFLVTVLLPAIAFADEGALNFRPPAQDVSVIFLSNIFGVVDGVLSGTGSQIVGQMMGVFNAAVLTLGGIIIFYTLVVSTMNTAQEGEVLGRKWSSIWVPVRSTIGIGLLLPKASGYCMMQIFVMWVIVQGVGAADKVWNSALSYLNRGGVIIQANKNPETSKMQGGGKILKGAQGILVAQVCMLSLQRALENLKADTHTKAACAKAKDWLTDSDPKKKAFYRFCNQPVPNFINSVDLTGVSVAGNEILSDYVGVSPKVNFPQFDANAYPGYSQLNGICGQITWATPNWQCGNRSAGNQDPCASLSGDAKTNCQKKQGYTAGDDYSVVATQGNTQKCSAKTDLQSKLGLTTSEASATKNSRAIAMQQMYITLASVAQQMVDNDAQLNKSFDCTNNNYKCSYDQVTKKYKCQYDFQNAQNKCASSHAKLAFGVPLNKAEGQCTADTTKCVAWGTVNSQGGTVLFTGTELQSAVAAYNGLMLPALAALQQTGSSKDYGRAALDAWGGNWHSAKSASQIYREERGFINDSKQSGWILAGSYFFKLARLNDKYKGQVDDNDNGIDYTLGMPNADPAIGSIGDLTNNIKCESATEYFYCLASGDGFDKATIDTKYISKIRKLLSNGYSGALPNPASPTPESGKPIYGNSSEDSATTVLDSNTTLGYIQNASILRMPGQAGQSAPEFTMNFNFKANSQVPYLGRASFSGGMFGIPGKVVTILYNGVVRTVFNTLLAIVMPIVNQLFFLIVAPPITLLTFTFGAAIKTISDPSINPIVALANMGSTYVNGTMTMWIAMAAASAGASITPNALGMLAVVMPPIMLWLGVMLTIGCLTAYYVPFVPYLLFTFGALSWFIVVIEAMVAAPIVALGITHPEGHEAFGKAEQATLLLLNVFLRPALMIFGLIFGIILSYVGLWLMNAGFQRILDGIQGMSNTGGSMVGGEAGATATDAVASGVASAAGGPSAVLTAGGRAQTPYNQWTGLFFYFFSLLVYTSLYISIVQQAFSLIHYLPDKVLRWMGGGDTIGESVASKGMGEVKQGVEKGAQATQQAMAGIGKKMGEKAKKAADKLKKGLQSTAGANNPGGGGGNPPGGGGSPPGGGQT